MSQVHILQFGEAKSVLMNFLGLYWTKRCRLNEGIFVHFVQKKGMCMARGVTSISSDGTVGQKGVNCKILQLFLGEIEAI